MNWLSPQNVKVKSLKLPGDIAQRQKQPHVAELAESIRERTGGRPIHLPTVEYPSMQLIAGRDRIAAQLLLGRKNVEVQLVSQVTEAERRDIERDENIHRRVDNRDELIRQRVLERELEIEAKRAEGGETERKPGRPKTAKGEAREEVARELGTTPDAVRVAEARAELPDICSETPEPLPCPVETYGLPLVTDVEAQELRDVQDAIDEADQALRRAQAALNRVAGVSLFRGAQQLIAQVHAAASELRAKRPEAVCPWCKRLPGLRCNGCGDSGFVGPVVAQGIAEELKLGGDLAMVVVHGRMVPYAKAKTAIPRQEMGRGGKPSPAAKRIRIEDEKGQALSPAEEETPPWETA